MLMQAIQIAAVSVAKYARCRVRKKQMKQHCVERLGRGDLPGPGLYGRWSSSSAVLAWPIVDLYTN